VLATPAAAHELVCKVGGFDNMSIGTPGSFHASATPPTEARRALLKVGSNYRGLKTQYPSVILSSSLSCDFFWNTYSGCGEEDGLKSCRVALIKTGPRSLIAINT
jgi:hypothetical protein